MNRVDRENKKTNWTVAQIHFLLALTLRCTKLFPTQPLLFIGTRQNSYFMDVLAAWR